MRTPHPNPYSTVSISHEVYLQLLAAAGETGFEKEDWEIAASAINDWVRRHSPDAIAMPATAGYQWKQLFLPNGTLLRTIFNGKNHHCLVEGDHILYEGRAMSPSGFVNAIGGIRRNAWKSLWILLPDTTTWKLADSLRTKKRLVRTRKSLQARTAQDAQSSAPLNATESGHFTQAGRPAAPTHPVRPPDHPASSRDRNTNDIARPPSQPAEIIPAGGGLLHDARLSRRCDRRKGNGSERQPDDSEGLAQLLRKALLVFSQLHPANSEASATL